MSMRDAFTSTAAALVDERPDVAVLTAGIGRGRFDDLGVSARHPHRVIELGIREQALVGAAAGMALGGVRPIVHTYAPFLVERAFEQIKLDLVHNEAPATLVTIGASFDASKEGRTHQAPGDVALLLTLPDVQIHVPGHPEEAAGLIRAAVDSGKTSYVRLSDFQNTQPVASDGLIHRVRDGSGPAVLAIGPMLGPVLDAVEPLGLPVLYTSTVAPFDSIGLAAEVDGDLIVVEPYLEGTTLGTINESLRFRPVRAVPIGVQRGEMRRYGTAADHLHAHGLDAVSLGRRLATVVQALSPVAEVLGHTRRPT